MNGQKDNREKIDYIIVDYHLDAEKAVAGKTKHYPSIVEARSKIIALFPDGCASCDTPLLREGKLYQKIEEAKREERERIKSLALQAIADEPEFPGDMPDELWKEIDGDREITQRVMQNTVRITKREITDRFVQALKEGK